MNKNNIYDDASLLKKVFVEDATEDEQLGADKLFIKYPHLKVEFDELHKSDVLKRSIKNNYSSSKAYHQFLHNINDKQSVSHKLNIRKWTYSAAAAAVLVLIMFMWQKNSVVNPVASKENIATSMNVSDDNNAGNATQVKAKGFLPAQITSYKNVAFVPVQKQLVPSVPSNVQIVSRPSDTIRTETQYNKFVIPRGQEKIVALSDGTIVHLNSASTLTYPNIFGGDKRTVMLEGEAYFDVTKDPSHPFVVETKYGNVTVLGTAFDVNAYKGACYTTLVRGRVLFTDKTNQEIVLSPGQQAIASNSILRKRDVNVEDYISWINGYYNFNHQSLAEIMSIVERWYDVKVIFDDPSLETITYTGTLKKYSHVNSFLDILEESDDLSCRIEGRDIYLSKK